MNEDVQQQSPANAATLATQAVNKACEACRTSKIRCQTEAGELQCQRCIRTGRKCIFNAPQVRKRRAWNTDSRVAELERQIKVLQLRLEEQQAISRKTGGNGILRGLRFQEPLTPAQWQQDPLLKVNAGLPEHLSQAEKYPQNEFDGLISGGVAHLLLSRYREHFESQYPFVVIPALWTLYDLRLQWPITFLAVLTATSASFDRDLHEKLNAELLNVTSKAMLLETERSLDLVRAMVVTAIWYSPTEKLESLKHYKYAHLAATMAIDLDEDEMKQDIEYHRTLLSCYFLCTGISLAMGRPTMIQYTEALQQSSASLVLSKTCPQNQKLSVWIELQRLAERVVLDFFTSSLDITRQDIQQAVDSACQRLDEWRQRLTFPLEESMAIHYYQVRSRILCICLYPDHPMEDFRPPFRIHPVSHHSCSSPALSPFFVRTSLNLITTLHNALDTILAMTPLSLLIAPVITYVRVCHAISVLLMLGTATLSSHHALSTIIDPPTLKVEHYLSSIITKALAAAAINNHKTPTRFCGMLTHMQRWWSAQRDGTGLALADLRPFLSTLEKIEGRGDAIPSAAAMGSGEGYVAVTDGSNGGASPETLDLTSFDLGELPDLDWGDFDAFLVEQVM